MADRPVTRTGKDNDGAITKLCGPWGRVDKWTAISHIEGRVHMYTSGGYAIDVVHDSTVTGGKYLRTDPGGGPSNNLDNLPDC